MNLKNGKIFTSKFVGTGPSSYEKRIYRAAVSQRLGNTALEDYLMLVSTAVKPSNKIRNCGILLVRSCTSIYTLSQCRVRGVKIVTYRQSFVEVVQGIWGGEGGSF